MRPARRSARLVVLLTPLLLGCAGTMPPPVYQPVAGPNTNAYFRDGAAIGAIEAESLFALVRIDDVVIAGADYVRLWILVESSSARPQL